MHQRLSSCPGRVKFIGCIYREFGLCFEMFRLFSRGCLGNGLRLPAVFQGFPTTCDLALSVAEQPGVVLRVLQVVFRTNSVASQLGIPGEGDILVDNLLWRSPNLSVRSGRIKNPIKDATDVVAPVTGFPA